MEEQKTFCLNKRQMWEFWCLLFIIPARDYYCFIHLQYCTRADDKEQKNEGTETDESTSRKPNESRGRKYVLSLRVGDLHTKFMYWCNCWSYHTYFQRYSSYWKTRSFSCWHHQMALDFLPNCNLAKPERSVAFSHKILPEVVKSWHRRHQKSLPS